MKSKTKVRKPVTFDGKVIGKANGWDEAACALVDHAVELYEADHRVNTNCNGIAIRCQCSELMKEELGLADMGFMKNPGDRQLITQETKSSWEIKVPEAT